MKRIGLALLLWMILDACMAQNVTETYNEVLLFKEYSPAVIELASGKYNHQPKANIFLKNSSLVYMQGKDVMEARMDVIRNVVINGRIYTNLNNKLAEVVDSCGQNVLLKVKLIDMEVLEHKFLNESSITNIELRDNVGVTRLESDLGGYPVTTYYYYKIGDKVVPCHEREVGKIVPKQNKIYYKNRTRLGTFSWADEDDLKDLLTIISRS